MVVLALLAGLVLPDYVLWTMFDGYEIVVWFGFVCFFGPRRWQGIALRLLLWLNLPLLGCLAGPTLPAEAVAICGVILLIGMIPGADETPLERGLRRLSGALFGLLVLEYVSGHSELISVQLAVGPVFLILGGMAVLNQIRVRVVRRWREVTLPRFREIRSNLRALRRPPEAPSHAQLCFEVCATRQPAETANRIRELYLR